MTGEILPDVQYMDNNYECYYLVPWPDYQKLEELDPEHEHVVPVIINHQPYCFVELAWVGNDYEEE